MDGLWAGWRAALARASDLLPSWTPASLPLPFFQLSDGLARKVAQLSKALLLSSAVVHEDKEWLRWCGKHYEVRRARPVGELLARTPPADHLASLGRALGRSARRPTTPEGSGSRPSYPRCPCSTSAAVRPTRRSLVRL